MSEAPLSPLLAIAGVTGSNFSRRPKRSVNGTLCFSKSCREKERVEEEKGHFMSERTSEKSLQSVCE